MRAIGRIAALAAAVLVAFACGSGSGTGSSTSSSCSKTTKVGLVTDVGKLSDKSFNANSWQGVVDAQNDASLCVSGKYIESNSKEDYQKNLRLFGDGGYDAVVAVGFNLGADAQTFAKAYPNVKVIMVDSAPDTPAPGNVVGLLFREDQAGFLAGAVSALYSKTGTIAGVYGLDIPPVHRYRVGFENGAKYVKPSVQTMGVYQTACNCPKDFNDPDWGKARGIEFADRGADVLFGAGGNTGNGALLAALQKKVACVGVDVDQFASYPEADPCLLTSAEKHLSLAVKSAITMVVKGQFKSGAQTFDATVNGVGVAPYHDFDSKLTADQKSKIQSIAAGLKDGSIQTGASTS
jgi:basic membrane protein A and related proteins